MESEWMNWGGWRWIAPLLGMAIGFAMGWYARAQRQDQIEFDKWLDGQTGEPSAGVAVADRSGEDRPDAC